MAAISTAIQSRSEDALRRPETAGARSGLSLHRAPTSGGAWDYLIVTASNEVQVRAYQSQLDVRRQQHRIDVAQQVLVVGDPQGRRIGSGGSTLRCLIEVLRRELHNDARALRDPAAWHEVLCRLRILILHAGGDSRRLPAYAACGKLFVPVPAPGELFGSLFDRQLGTFLALPAAQEGAGQIVIASGDTLLDFDPNEVTLTTGGITGLGCLAPAGRSAKHGVYHPGADGRVEFFVQKPTVAQQNAKGLLDRYARSVLDVGVMSFDAATAVAMLEMVSTRVQQQTGLAWSGELGDAVDSHGLDFYREIACALGDRITEADYIEAVRVAGSTWDDARLARIFEALRGVDFHLQVLSQCSFLHFGTTRQLLASGAELLRQDARLRQDNTWLSVNNEIGSSGNVAGKDAWVEGCRIRAPLVLDGANLAAGLDVDRPLRLPRGACLDVVAGEDRNGEPVFFVRCYGIDDAFKRADGQPNRYCGRSLDAWLDSVGAGAEDVWDASIAVSQRSLWNARVIPAGRRHADYRKWLWTFDPDKASASEKRAWLEADRYSFAEMATLTDQEAFHGRRAGLRAAVLQESIDELFSLDSEFSAIELAYLLRHAERPAAWVARILQDVYRRCENPESTGRVDSLVPSRMMHTLGSAVAQVAEIDADVAATILPDLREMLSPQLDAWLQSVGLHGDADTSIGAWAARAQATAFDRLRLAIVSSGTDRVPVTTGNLRSDEIIWGRAPARLDLCGGWTDTPPYTLEYGGCVLNAAVNLNGQPPIQAFARIVDEAVIRIVSIDCGTRTEIFSLKELLDYRVVTSEFSLAKAALALSAVSPEQIAHPDGLALKKILEPFGGGVELTTLAAIPKGSGLGTSSIMGAVLLAVLDRLLGRAADAKSLFHRVLQLEQTLTTGGGWQDQIGGAVDGVKLITTRPGMIPHPVIEFVPADVLDPAQNGGRTLLYYTGLTRLAKNILGRVVGRHLDRDPVATS
ncbi:MAG: hypothetical protein HQ567_25105, partial [Candidatus Nealsonbacteria bacterium]|nr:hypothetical protein [Candidatus Nealsonbacteria bacterium]